jgi:NTE family protein
MEFAWQAAPQDPIAALRDLPLFRDLSDEDLRIVASGVRLRSLARGEALITEGDAAEAFFLVVSGRFESRAGESGHVIAEIGVGQPIGEISFFAGGGRRASVVDLRPSLVAEIDRAGFEIIKSVAPGIEANLIKSLAHKLDAMTRNWLNMPSLAPLSTVAIIAGGAGDFPPIFLERLRESFSGSRDAVAVGSSDERLRRGRKGLVAFIADAGLTAWTKACLEQADELIIVVDGDPPQPLNEVEIYAYDLIPAARRKLARVHQWRRGAVDGTRKFLEGREVGMIHHLALQDQSDFESLHRFMTNRAIGLVAGGGGAFGTAHIGIYKALQERGVVFDIFGGTSVGAAMTAAFSMLLRPQDVIDGLRHIFIESRALRKMTVPRYSLLDHHPFDEALKRRYRDADIEDVWKPFLAVATDLTMNRLRLLRSGPLWKAVRASTSILGVLPPIFAEDGAMLVDGGIADNVPIDPMARLKVGPNVVVSLCALAGRSDVDYERIPGRGELNLNYFNPLGREFPACPGPISVIQKSVFANIRQRATDAGPLDLILSPPSFPGSSFMDWSRYRDVFEASYIWAQQELRRLEEAGNSALAEIDRSR